MDVPADAPENRIKASIEDEMIIISKFPGYAPSLRILLNSNMPGNIVNTFEQFKLHFDCLFTLSSDRKGLNKDTVKKTKDWIHTRHKPKLSDMRAGLELFDEYKTELFKTNVI